MWDYSWLLRHHPGGSFEDWDHVLGELVERGYDCIRIDVFPELIAASPDGVFEESFLFGIENWEPVLWGNTRRIKVTPRSSLIRFLDKCRSHQVKVIASSWMNACERSGRRDRLEGAGELARAWSETLAWIESHGLLDTLLYVDLLNEFPMYHGFSWLKRSLDTLREPAPVEHRTFNDRQIAHYNRFASETLAPLQDRWSDLPFTFSTTHIADQVPWKDLTMEGWGVFDSHLWFYHYPPIWAANPNVHGLKNDDTFPAAQRSLDALWSEHRSAATEWVRGQIAEIAVRATSLGIPVGNTEGWGMIFWHVHPELRWDFMKETAEIAVPLCREAGYAFNCTSNFTHPHFPGIWDDVAWHRRLTAQIRQPLAPARHF